MFVATKYFCSDKTFVATKMILMTAPASDRLHHRSWKTVNQLTAFSCCWNGNTFISTQTNQTFFLSSWTGLRWIHLRGTGTSDQTGPFLNYNCLKIPLQPLTISVIAADNSLVFSLISADNSVTAAGDFSYNRWQVLSVITTAEKFSCNCWQVLLQLLTVSVITADNFSYNCWQFLL